MKASGIALQIILASFGFALIACVQTPQYRMPTTEVPYRLPPCGAFEIRTPCQRPVVREEISACEKRFGKICNRTSP